MTAGDGGFDEAEMRMLRGYFRDEAHEYLETVTRRLLHAANGALDGAALAEIMRTTHTLKGSAATVGLDEVAETAHSLEDCFARLRSHSLTWSGALAERLVEAVDSMRALIDAADDQSALAPLAQRLRQQLRVLRAFEEPAVETPIAPATGRRSIATSSASGAEAAAAAHVPETESAGTALSDPAGARAIRASDPATGPVSGRERRAGESQILRVDPERIDLLMNSVGELVFDRTRIDRRSSELRRLVRELSQTRQRLRGLLEPARAGDSNLAASMIAVEQDLARHISLLSRATSALSEDAASLQRTARALQTGLTRVRMGGVRALFERLARSLRTIAKQAGKRVELVTSGEDTEFDRAVVDQIADPLLHILRNAVVHGIESEEERVELGKSPVGRVRISARQERDAVFLEISDDGAGIDPGQLRESLVRRGQWTKEQASKASEPAVLRAVFEPGVSTRDRADELAGRGVGLDAVRETIARLGGDIRLDSTRGESTVFTLRLPLTTAVSQAMLFKIAGNVYAIPNAHVVESTSIELDSAAAIEPANRSAPTGARGLPTELAGPRGPIPLLDLRALLGAPPVEGARRAPLLVIEYAGKRFAINCDRVIGPREIIVKSLGPIVGNLPLFAGGTISGSGKVQLILETAALVRLAHPSAEPDSDDADDESGRRSSSITAEIPALAGRVLVADDSPAIRESIARMLTSAGFIVDLAGDGQAALAMLRELHYDALVTDIEMPKLSGLELLEAVRADRELAALPVVVVTARTAPANRHRARLLGARAFLAKPVARQRLLAEVRALLDG